MHITLKLNDRKTSRVSPFPFKKTARAQNFILDQFVDTSLKHTKTKHISSNKNNPKGKIKNPEGKIVSITQPLLILQSINEQQLSIVDF